MSGNARNTGIIQSRMENGKQNSSTLSLAKNMSIQGQGFYSMGYMRGFFFGGGGGVFQNNILSGKGKQPL